MIDPDGSKKPLNSRLARKIGKKEARKLQARQEGRNHPIQSLALFGLVGWSVALPTLLSLALGIWIDSRWPGRVSWTLTLMLVGIVIGCINAWQVIKKELTRPNRKEGKHDANHQQ